MSRGIRDLREIICVSRLNGVCDGGEDQSGDDNRMARRALPGIVGGAGDGLEDLVAHLALINDRVVGRWLCKANVELGELVRLANDHSAYVHFMNFWLAELTADARLALCGDVYGRIFHQLQVAVGQCLAGASGGGDGSAERAITSRVLAVAFWEYEAHFMSSPRNDAVASDSAHSLLRLVDCLGGGRTDAYKSLLARLNVDSRNSDLVQYALSVRAFALVSFVAAIVAHYRQSERHLVLPTVAMAMAVDEALLARLSLAIRHQFIDTLRYLMDAKNVDFQHFRDEHGRSLLMIAVSYNSASVLQYFINNFDTRDIINCSSDTGNGALHLAVCQGSMDLVRLLVVDGGADVNMVNLECDNCTPLHMATVYGHEAIAKFLVERGALAPSMETGIGDSDDNNTRGHEQTVRHTQRSGSVLSNEDEVLGAK